MSIPVAMKLTLLLLMIVVATASNRPSFTVDWENDRFLRNGKPYQYASAGMHYFRIPYQYWENRIYAAKTAGMNTIQTYVAWNQHEPSPGVYNFEGNLDIVNFIKEVGRQDMNLILRVGPYICAEWNFGGLPPWLLAIPGMQVRSQNEDFLFAVTRWFKEFFPRVRPYLYSNGGPIIMVQVENEYGSFGCDHTYIKILFGMYKKYLSHDVVLFTTDGPGGIQCGSLNTTDILTTIDFGTGGDPGSHFDNLKKYQPHGPHVNSEFYSGWLDHWKHKHSTREAAPLGEAFDKLLALGVSVNLYMWHGGTNFGLTSGAEKNFLEPNPTSYDYDAPQSEWGDLKMDKYHALRNVTDKYFPGNKLPVPPNSKKLGGKTVELVEAATLASQISASTLLKASTYPITMEALGVFEGMIAYQHKLAAPIQNTNLGVLGVHDRAFVMVDGVFMKIVKRDEVSLLHVDAAKDTITIFVENQGYIGFGKAMQEYIFQYKGLMNVTLDEVNVTEWSHYKIDVRNPSVYRTVPTTYSSKPENLGKLTHNGKTLIAGGPTVYSGVLNLEADECLDTFLDTTGWSKGYLIVNEILIGRYWPDAGPQYSLYVPGVYLREGRNSITMIELEAAKPELTVSLSDKPNIDGPVNPDA